MFGKFYLFILNILRSSKLFTYFLWGIKIDKYCHTTFWDLTSLVIKKELSIVKEEKYLDMGCGQFAILGQFYKKRNVNSKIVSVDIYDDLVENSFNNSKINKNDIQIIQSNLFDNVNEKFDLISFNPPYVPQKQDDKVKYTKIRYSANDGTETMSLFLGKAKNFLSNDGKIILGVNSYYVDKEKCLSLIKEYGYDIKKITKILLNSSIAFTIQKSTK